MKVGDQIVCVDDSRGRFSKVKALIKYNVYIFEMPSLIIGEIFVNCGTGKSWSSSRFVPLDEYLDGISITAEIEECLTREFQEV